MLEERIKSILLKPDYVVTDDSEISVGAKMLNHNNVVSKEKLRKIQCEILNQLSDIVSATYGPMGSNTMIVTGESSQTILSNYSKDGLKVLKYIAFSQPLEMTIQSEMVDIAKFVEKQVGDGTTSSVILTAAIFNKLARLEKEEDIAPRKLIQIFQDVVKELSEKILENKRQVTIDDIYNICMISTNGNEKISRDIETLYNQFGMDVSIDVGISNDENTKIKTYDGLTVNEGYSDPAYINNPTNNTAEIHNPRIYAFADPIDTGEMVSYLEKIILTNIFEPAQNEQEMIPTVIVAPHITRDASALMSKLIELMYQYTSNNMDSQKPPICIVNNITGTDEAICNDITMLCGCKPIRKYIDPAIQKKDQESGEAPTLDNVADWFGTAELVVSDSVKTKFINPANKPKEENPTYKVLLDFLKNEIEKAKAEDADSGEIGRLKKRVRCLEANMVEFLIGGITVSDRDALKDLVEDAVKNCASAVADGVGRASNFEGLLASYNESSKDCAEDASYFERIKYKIKEIIFESYCEAAFILYRTVLSENDSIKAISKSIENGNPYNITDFFETENFDEVSVSDKVLTSIKTDVVILEAISRVVTNMVTANQCLLQSPSVNRY